jgi:hypothetical protein
MDTRLRSRFQPGQAVVGWRTVDVRLDLFTSTMKVRVIEPLK